MRGLLGRLSQGARNLAGRAVSAVRGRGARAPADDLRRPGRSRVRRAAGGDIRPKRHGTGSGGRGGLAAGGA